MGDRATLDALLSESRRAERPEVRAKSSIGLVSFVSEMPDVEVGAADSDATGIEDTKDLLNMEAWMAIVYSLTDEWPLVRDAFQEQLIRAMQLSEAFLRAIQEDTFIDHIISGIQKSCWTSQDKLRAVSGILSLARICLSAKDSTRVELWNTKTWDKERVRCLVAITVESWINSSASERESSIIDMLTGSFTGSQLIQAMGAIVSSRHIQSKQSQKLVQFVEAVLQGLRQEQVDTVNQGPDRGTLAVLEPKDWVLALWLCDQLRVPPVFSTLESIHESAATKAIADTFVKRLHTLLECIGHLLRLQTVDNTLTLHRLIVACAAFTSPKDLWVKHDPQISKSIMTKAQEILTTLFQTTPWSIPSTSSISFASPTDSATVSAPSYNPKVIRIPGSFSDHVIKILEKDIRSCFTHVKANKMVERAQTTISQHQQKMRQTVQTIEDAEGLTATTGTITVTGEEELVSIHPQHGATASSQKIMIAPVVDTPNDEEELWTAMDDESNMDPRQPRRWDKNFPESVPVLEWCTQQQIQDPSRVHEVFMLLVGPILAMMDSVHKRYQIRGLDLLSRFLIQYHDPSMNDRSTSKSQRDDQRIWIKIFERTGLDQVLERNLKPLLSPLQASNTLETPTEVAQSNEQLEALQAAFRAYLILILVNTEPRDRPATETDDPHPTSMRGRNAVRDGINGDTTTTLTIENLFLHGILGRIRGMNLSKEYLSLVFEWMERLIRPVIAFDSILEQLPPNQLDLTRAPDGSASIIATESVLVFGMGSLTIKYLQSLLEFIFNVLDYQFPSSPATTRLQSLNLAWRASNALHAVMETSKPRIPRYRGKLMASIANCWANSRIFPSESSKLEAAAKTSSYTLDLATAQARLDQSLIRSMQLCISICRPKSVEDASSGLEMDLQALKDLDPAIFGPLFASE